MTCAVACETHAQRRLLTADQTRTVIWYYCVIRCMAETNNLVVRDAIYGRYRINSSSGALLTAGWSLVQLFIGRFSVQWIFGCRDRLSKVITLSALSCGVQFCTDKLHSWEARVCCCVLNTRVTWCLRCHLSSTNSGLEKRAKRGFLNSDLKL